MHPDCGGDKEKTFEIEHSFMQDIYYLEREINREKERKKGRGRERNKRKAHKKRSPTRKY